VAYLCSGAKENHLRLQDYAGPALATRNQTLRLTPSTGANGEMGDRNLFCDQLVPPAAVPRHAATAPSTLCRVTTTPLPHGGVSVFGGYFPFASRYSLDCAVLSKIRAQGIWEEAYGELRGVTLARPGAWGPCNFATVKPINSLGRFSKGKRIFTFPTAGSFFRFGVWCPLDLPWGNDVEVAMRRANGTDCLFGHYEDYHRGWADVDQLLF